MSDWILVSDRVPNDIKPVLVTWKNIDPESYYQYIVGKHFIGTAHYKSGKWYWYSSVTEDLLAEYGKCDSEEFDEAIEVVAWMPLPEPYKDKNISGNEGDRLYIKIYADMEPGDIAEKVYCICNEEKLPEVVDILSEIVRDNCEEVNK